MVVVVTAALFAWPLATRGIVLSDEGYLLAQVDAILSGQVLYRDLDAFVSPGIWYLLAGWFRLLGTSVLTERFLAIACFAGTCLVVHRIVTKLAPPVFAWGALGGLFILLVWAFSLWTFAFYSGFAVLFALAALARLLAWRETRRGRDVLMAGVLVGISLVFKQNYGALALAGIAAGIAACEVEKRGLGPGMRAAWIRAPLLLLGVLGVVVPVALYFASEGALQSLYESIILHPFYFGARQDIPYLTPTSVWTGSLGSAVDRYTYGAPAFINLGPPWVFSWIPGFTERLHGLLFWLPPLLLALGSFVAIRPMLRGERLDGALATITLMAGAIFLGVFPRADYAHLLYVYAPFPVLIAILVARLAGELHRPVVRVARGVGLLLLVVFTVASGSWYQRALQHYTEPLKLERGGVVLRNLDALSLTNMVEFLRANTEPHDLVLTVPDLSMLNFLSRRSQPGRYFNLYEHHIAHDGGREVVESAEESRVGWVVTRYDNFFSDRVPLRDYAPHLWRYLRSRFSIEFVHFENQSIVLRRRNEWVPEHAAVSVLPGCEDRGSERPGGEVRNHLLFSTLALFPAMEDGFVELHCELTIPEGGVFVASLGAPRAVFMERGAKLAIEVWAESDLGRELLLEEQLRLRLRQAWRETRWTERRIDLSHLAGRSVKLLFRADLIGQAWLGIPGDLPAEWIDPRVEITP